MRIYWLDNLSKGGIGMMPRPRGNDWLMDEISHLKKIEVDHVVSLLEAHEMQELELEKEQEYCEKQGIAFSNFPIVDCTVPSSKIAFDTFVQKMVHEVQKGKKIAVHCRMGIGRTSTLVAAMLIRMGLQEANVFEYLSEIRTLKVPDTAEQKAWVLRNCLGDD